MDIVGKFRKPRRVVVATALAVGAVAVPVIAAPPASAGYSGCWAGKDAGTDHWAWGSCSGVTGNTHWRLHVSCTWGDTRYSTWFYGSGRTDVECPGVETVRDQYVEIAN
jgi:hypothetical protein